VLEVQKPVLPAVAPVLEKFEAVANTVRLNCSRRIAPTMKRQIHPLVLCSPFLYRTFQKPLGYAGDYEMVNMMTRDPYEGGSMFAKLVNRIFLENAAGRGAPEADCLFDGSFGRRGAAGCGAEWSDAGL